MSIKFSKKDEIETKIKELNTWELELIKEINLQNELILEQHRKPARLEARASVYKAANLSPDDVSAEEQPKEPDYNKLARSESLLKSIKDELIKLKEELKHTN